MQKPQGGEENYAASYKHTMSKPPVRVGLREHEWCMVTTMLTSGCEQPTQASELHDSTCQPLILSPFAIGLNRTLGSMETKSARAGDGAGFNIPQLTPGSR
jgi:hypothetical protein